MRRFFVSIILNALAMCASTAMAQVNNIDHGIVPDPNPVPQATQMAVDSDVDAASTTSITFNEYPVNTVITNQFEAQGVIFNQAFIELDYFPTPRYLSGDNESYPYPYGNGLNAAPITANFTAPTSFVEADPVYLDSGASMTIIALDKNGAVIGSASGSSRLRVTATGIRKAVFSFYHLSRIDDIAGIDNLAFDSVNCPVEGLSDLPSDPCTQSLEAGNGQDVHRACRELSDPMKLQADCLKQKIRALGAPFSDWESTIRTEAYQRHFSEMWGKLIELKDLLDKPDLAPGIRQACTKRQAEIEAHKNKHQIDGKPSSRGSQAPHVNGNAVDVSKATVNAMANQFRDDSSVGLQDYIRNPMFGTPACKLCWGGMFPKNEYDPVHFQYCP